MLNAHTPTPTPTHPPVACVCLCVCVCVCVCIIICVFKHFHPMIHSALDANSVTNAYHPGTLTERETAIVAIFRCAQDILVTFRLFFSVLIAMRTTLSMKNGPFFTASGVSCHCGRGSVSPSFPPLFPFGASCHRFPEFPGVGRSRKALHSSHSVGAWCCIFATA